MQQTDYSLIFRFLRQLALHNDRQWFQDNKAQYLQAQEAAAALIQSCIASLSAQFPLDNPDARQCMFRIYRDVRFSANKNPYKTSFSALLAPGGRKSASVFSWYLHLEPDNCFLASGIYEPSPAQLAAIRQEIAWNAPAFREILAPLEKDFGALLGDPLKTAPKGYSREHPEIDFLRLTRFYFMKSYPEKSLSDPDFPLRFSGDCMQLLPFLQFLHTATS